MSETQRRVGEITHGLYLKRERTCPCGAVFVARKPTATYCSAACRVVHGRYGRNYGQYEPTRLRVWRS